MWLAGLLAAALVPLCPDGLLVSSARADVSPIDLSKLCSTSSGQCAPYPGPAPLLDPTALDYATPSQADALRAFERLAVQDVMADHGLPDSDLNAVQSWGRPDAQAELWMLIVQAIQKTPAQRSANQQQVTDWMADLYRSQQNAEAQHAGAEYARWAGLEVGDYWNIAATGSEAQLGSFLSQPVEPFNTPDTAHATGGYCTYHPPAPDSGDYDGSSTPTCFTPCQSPVGCPVPTPTYDQFTSWGQAATIYPTLTSTEFQLNASSIAGGLALLGSVAGAAIAGLTLSVTVPAATLTDLVTSIVGAAVEDAAGEVSMVFDSVLAGATSIAFVVAVVLAAVVESVLEGIRVATDAKLPLQLAQLVVASRSAAVDLPSMIGDSTQLTVLYNLFVSATGPRPRSDANCAWEDNPPAGSVQGISPTTLSYFLVDGAVDPSQLNAGCLNPPAIPAAAPADPDFQVTPQAGGAVTHVPSISLSDQQAGYTSTVRLSGTWFVQHVTKTTGETGDAQSLRLHYIDWAGAPQQATLLRSGGGYVFVGVSTPAGATASSIDPSTCVASGTCWKSDHIQYVGADGKKYSASVSDPTPPPSAVGAPVIPAHVQEGTPVTLKAGTFGPPDAVHGLEYRWVFHSAGCGLYVDCLGTIGGGCDPRVLVCTPDNSGAVAGPQATYTWQGPGNGSVTLTADDGSGHSVTQTFAVPVGNIAPTVTVRPDCAHAPAPCDVRKVPVPGTPITLTGLAQDVGSDDSENLVVTWGDGSTDTAAAGHSSTIGILNPQLQVNAGANPDSYPFTGVHTYRNPGIYYGTVAVSDWGGGTDTDSFTVTVQGTNAKVAFDALGDQVYGGQVHLTARAAFGPVVDFAASPASVCTTSGAHGADLVMVGVGQCTVVASQNGSDPAQQTFSVKPAPLRITADDQTQVYGGAGPAFSASYDGLVNGDTKADISGVTLSGPPSGSGVGHYPITVSGGSNPNYQVTGVDGTETVTAAPLTITVHDATKVYGRADPAFSASYDGFVNGDTQAVVSGLTIAGPPATSGVGAYPIHGSGASSPNYAMTYVDGTETVTPSALLIKVDAKTVASGAVPAYTWTGVGWVNGDSDATLSRSPHQAPLCSARVAGTAVSASTPPGTYPRAITCQGAVDADYTITYAGAASLTIDPVVTLAQTGLPARVAAKATLDGVSVTLPVTKREVGYHTTHSYRFPGAVVGPDGTIYTTATPGFKGKVTSNLVVTASYASMSALIDAAVASGAMSSAIGATLTAVWAKAQTDLKAGRTTVARVDVVAFAVLVVAGRLINKITQATTTTLLSRAQATFTTIGRRGSL
ncbi:MAG TPA: MBG domain-containing protein [Nocardioides sp.]|nr:MBG domain-containing protein [Nocardioides sp.]